MPNLDYRQPHDRAAQFLETLPSGAFRRTLQLARKFAENGFVSIQISGPIGAGKTQLFHYIHSRSPRRAQPHVIVSLSGLDENSSFSRLFGHVRGAYTGALHARSGAFQTARDGTISLDEIAKCSLPVQRQLLEVIDPGTYSPLGSDEVHQRRCRILAATNVDLEPLVERGEFLDDLKSRLEGFRIVLPALAERRADIPEWARWFLVETWAEWKKEGPTPSLDPDLLHALQGAPLRRNLRELKQIVQCLLIEAGSARVITPSHCTGDLSHLVHGSRRLRDYSLGELDALLESHRHKVSQVAKQIGAHRGSLHKQLKRLRAASRRAS